VGIRKRRSNGNPNIRFVIKGIIAFKCTKSIIRSKNRRRRHSSRVVNHELAGMFFKVLLEVLNGGLQLEQLMQSKVINRALPPELPLPSFPHMVQIIPSLLFTLQKAKNLSELHVQITNIGIPMSLNQVVRTGVLWRVPRGVAIDEGLNFWVPKREGLISRRENHDRDLYPTKGAEFTGFLEHSRTTFRERNLQMTLLRYFLYWDLLATQARLFALRHAPTNYKTIPPFGIALFQGKLFALFYITESLLYTCPI